MAAQGTPATRELVSRAVPHTLHPYDHDPGAASYGQEAADKLGIDPARVFKGWWPASTTD
jgi:Cys-tRNA(Pro)/Cys-tRNA(Cys) deacylase